MRSSLKITILVDNPKSWVIPYAKKLQKILSKKHRVRFSNSARKVIGGDCLFLLGCNRILPKSILKLNKHNIVVHESYLPKGKGFSPLTWQIIEGRRRIPITLLEAEEKVDTGKIYLRDFINYRGDELVDELRKRQGEKTIELIRMFLKRYPNIKGRAQKGNESFYRRRLPADSRLDIGKTLEGQFNKLRTVDNEIYPAYFRYKGHTYILKIFKKGR